MATVPCTFCAKYSQAHTECPNYKKCGSWCGYFTFTEDYGFVRAFRLGVDIETAPPSWIYQHFSAPLIYNAHLKNPYVSDEIDRQNGLYRYCDRYGFERVIPYSEYLRRKAEYEKVLRGCAGDK